MVHRKSQLKGYKDRYSQRKFISVIPYSLSPFWGSGGLDDFKKNRNEKNLGMG